jgi:hypothetical protein
VDDATSENCPKRKANFAEAASRAPTRYLRLGSYLDRAFPDALLSRHLHPPLRRRLLPRTPPGPRRPSRPRPYLAPFSGTPLGSSFRRTQANSPNYLRPNGLSFTFTPHRYHDARSASVAHPHLRCLSEYLVELLRKPLSRSSQDPTRLPLVDSSRERRDKANRHILRSRHRRSQARREHRLRGAQGAGGPPLPEVGQSHATLRAGRARPGGWLPDAARLLPWAGVHGRGPRAPVLEDDIAPGPFPGHGPRCRV